MVKTGEASDAVRLALTERLFSHKTVLISGGLSQLAIGAIGYFRTGGRWFMVWGILATVILAARLLIDAAFWRCDHRLGDIEVWRRRFLIGTWAMGATCGLGAIVALEAADMHMQLLAITMITIFVMGSATRNGVYFEAAAGSVLLAEVPFLIALVATRQSTYLVMALFRVAFIISALGIARHFYKQTVTTLVTNERNIALVKAIQTSNHELTRANENYADANSQLAAANEQLGTANAKLATANEQYTELNKRLAITNAKFAAANAKLAAMPTDDALTGLANRKKLTDLLEVEVCAAARDHSSLTVLIINVDWFKLYNERYGKSGGDESLRLIAKEISQRLRRPRDLLARIESDEFVALLPQTDVTGAMIVAKSLLETVRQLRLEFAESPLGVLTVSIGITNCVATGKTTDNLLARAKSALQIAKRSGRNCFHTEYATELIPEAADGAPLLLVTAPAARQRSALA